MTKHFNKRNINTCIHFFFCLFVSLVQMKNQHTLKSCDGWLRSDCRSAKYCSIFSLSFSRSILIHVMWMMMNNCNEVGRLQTNWSGLSIMWLFQGNGYTQAARDALCQNEFASFLKRVYSEKKRPCSGGANSNSFLFFTSPCFCRASVHMKTNRMSQTSSSFEKNDKKTLPCIQSEQEI